MVLTISNIRSPNDVHCAIDPAVFANIINYCRMFEQTEFIILRSMRFCVRRNSVYGNFIYTIPP